MTADGFKLTKFFELPWPILQQICSYLEIEQLTQLMDAPQLQEMIFDLLCRGNLHILTRQRQVQVFWKQKYVAINKSSIADFFESYPDISPRTYCVIVQGGFVHDVTTCLHQRLNRAENIAICSSDDPFEKVTGHDLRLLFSYPGIQAVELDRGIIRQHDVELAYWIPQITGLKSIRLEVENCTQLPFLSRLAHLKCLEISTVDYIADSRSDFQADSTHKMLCKIFSQDSFLPGFTSRDLRFPPLLKTLVLNELCLEKVEVSYLPPTLESLDLSYNKIDTFEHEKKNPSWPVNLKWINLRSNLICDLSLKELVLIQWPPFLQTLDLSDNHITSLENLRDLPDSITQLKLSGILSSLQVSHNLDGDPFFRFPKSLRTLSLEPCEFLLNDEDYDYVHRDLQGRIKFPSNLEHLTLIDVSEKDCLRNLIFPPTLKTLHLKAVGIQNLNSYNSLPGDVQEVNWAQLTNLRELNLNSNKMSSLTHWRPPRSLRTLELAGNKITALESESTPLFNENCRQMTQNILRIDLSSNDLETIDNNVYLAENLCELNLSENCLSEFVFTESFASHRNLLKLDLQHNNITKLSVHNREKTYASQLQELYLYSDTYSILPDDCDDVFEQLGLVPTRSPGESWPPAETDDWVGAWKAERRSRTFYFKH